ncbi:helix-turn-helix domain-containing protein [Gorillibacterium massiliense]|uniref:helix-turn-helix domain-containing protein n=1 Tax=Gorillibacterium massiliense TaxID=1280390 RepID=UPI0004B35933|nr:AraC family transcriptional regulator [Gorillibacterium massiliense]
MNRPPYDPVQANSTNLSIPGRYREWKPSLQLSKYIFCYWYTQQTNYSKLECPDSVEMIVPDGCIDIVFRIDRSLPDIQGLIIGTMDRAIMVDMEYDRVESFGIRFYPGGLQPFVREPAHLFTNRINDLSDVAKGFAQGLKGHLHWTSSIDQTIYGLERYLLSKLSDDLVWEDTFQNCLMHIYQAKGNISVKEIACKEAISERQLTRIFYGRAGVGTKTFSRIIRFQHLLRLLHGTEKITLTDAAIQGGYYDQAHCIREFQDLCSILPSDYMKPRI